MAAEFSRVAPDVELGRDVKIYGFVNLYGCRLGDETRVGAFVEIQRGATVGARCKISSHTFICEGVTIEDEVFVGHGVMFTNDRLPRATRPDRSALLDLDEGADARLVADAAAVEVDEAVDAHVAPQLHVGGDEAELARHQRAAPPRPLPAAAASAPSGAPSSSE